MKMFTSGSHVGRYLLGTKLGQGGFGSVFRAYDASLDRDVALKFLHAEHNATPEILQRFLQEARSAAKIQHPGIVTVYECGQLAESGNVAYIAMELLAGESLADRLARGGRVPADDAMEIARQVASALEAAHIAGIVHRDLKPDNIFLVKDPAVYSGERVKVLDFGIAKLERTASPVTTQSMVVFGTPRYMSPEQCKSAANVDVRSDIYTLGCILFELVCGVAPFDGSVGELIAHHVLAPAPRASSIVRDLPPALDALIASMLAKRPADRPATMAAVQRALEAGGALSPGVAPTLLPGAFATAHRSRPPSKPPTAAQHTTTLAMAASSSIASPIAHAWRRRAAVATIATTIGIAAVWIVPHGSAVAPTIATTQSPPDVARSPVAPAPAAPPPPAAPIVAHKPPIEPPLDPVVTPPAKPQPHKPPRPPVPSSVVTPAPPEPAADRPTIDRDNLIDPRRDKPPTHRTDGTINPFSHREGP